MVDKPNLRNKIGILIPHHEVKAAEWWLAAGVRHFACGVEWSVFEPQKGTYIFDVAKTVFKLIADAGGTILVHLFLVPSWERNSAWPADFEYPRVNNHPFALPIIRDEWVPDWVEYVRRFLEWAEQFGSAISVCGPIRETNLPGWWQVERTPQEVKDRVKPKERDPEDFIKLVIRPVAPIIRFTGRKVIAGTVTIQGEKSWSYKRALKYFRHYQSRNFGSIDHMDFHVYREVGSQTVNDVKRFIEDTELKNRVWISEMGFNEKGGFTVFEQIGNLFKTGKFDRGYTGEQKQERKFKQWFEFLTSSNPEEKALADKIFRAYHYRSHDVEDETTTDGLLKANFQPKRAALLMREYLQAA